MTTLERLMEKVSPEPNSGCWLWLGATTGAGYAHTRLGYAHRLIYEELRGPIPKGLELDHLCRVRCCVNPQHLEPVTRRENIARSPYAPAKRTHCPKGHPYDSSNTYHNKNNKRACRKCHSQRESERRRSEK